MRAGPDDRLLSDGAHVSQELARHVLICRDGCYALDGASLVLLAVMVIHVGISVRISISISVSISISTSAGTL